jgi:hypothetical protein
MYPVVLCRNSSGVFDQLNELGGFLRLLGEQDAAGVGEDADRISVQFGPSGHQAAAVERLELVEIGAVDDAGDHLARIERDLQIRGNDAEQIVLVIQRLDHLGARGGTLLAPVEPLDDGAADADRVLLVECVVVGETGDAGVHVRAAEGFVVGLLTGGHLDQRRTAEEDLGALLDHHHVVGHAWDVGAARCRVAENQCDGRDARRRGLGEVAEHPAAGNEHLLLRRQIRTTGFDEGDDR